MGGGNSLFEAPAIWLHVTEHYVLGHLSASDWAERVGEELETLHGQFSQAFADAGFP